jgi:DNA-entry nuclease
VKKNVIKTLGLALASVLLAFGSVGVLPSNLTATTPTVAQAKTVKATHKKKKTTKKASQVSSATNQTNQELANSTYSGQITIEVNGNKPSFTSADLSTKQGAWQTFGNLDTLNRPTDAEALLNLAMQPTEKREALTVKPTGWHNKKLKKGYLYNRSHLIGFQLSGENNNPKNLITGTRQLNDPEMLRYEDEINDYLEAHPKDFVRYSVIPVFKDQELVARGVHLQAQSINSTSVSFNVFIYNIEDGVTINYTDGTSVVDNTGTAISTPSSSASNSASSSASSTPAVAVTPSAATDTQSRTVYVAPDSGTKYHYLSTCRGLSQANTVSTMTEAEAIAQGYTLCGWED